MGSTPQKGTYSASQVSTLIGLNQFATPLAAFQTLKETAEPGWNAAHGYTLPPAPDNPAIRWGLAFEDAIIKLAEEKEGCDIIHREMYYHREFGGRLERTNFLLSCHIDGQFASGYHAHPVLAENKTTNHWAYSSTKKEITDSLGNDGQLENGFNIIRKWGDPGTDQVPQEYQIQAAVQRICTGAELVKLTVMVFEKAQQAYEDAGWQAIKENDGSYTLVFKENEKRVRPQVWADAMQMFGNVHQYLLPSNPKLETAIIEAVQKFHVKNFLPGIPPAPSDFADVRRLLPNPLGTVIATPELITLCREYSENTRQLGTASPIRARQEILKTQISDQANQLRRSDPTSPADKFLILDPNGGDTLATVGKDKNGLISFRAARAK